MTILSIVLLAACFPDFNAQTAETFVENPIHDYDGDGLIDAEDCDDGNPDIMRMITVYRDSDGDGFGVINGAINICPQDLEEGYVEAQIRNGNEAFDCDDTNALVNPDAPEQCDDLDNNCDGEVDNYNGVDATLFYLDRDGDGYGDITAYEYACEGHQPEGYILQVGDCDDSSANNYPNAIEYCDSVDNNCNGVIDEPTAADAQEWFEDLDNDGFGSKTIRITACEQPENYIETTGDCDDTSNSVYPNADEYCNGIDDNCDSVIDEPTAVDAQFYYPDQDEDSFGAMVDGTAFCYPQAGYVTNNSDCDDYTQSINPNASEVCNNLDDDCDGGVDDDDPDETPLFQVQYYADPDGDLYGDLSQPILSCPSYSNGVESIPVGLADNGMDCDESLTDLDGNGVADGAAINPSASELCTEFIDENCDGYPMLGAIDTPTFYADFDFDGHGNQAYSVQVCQEPYGYVRYEPGHEFDCDDSDPDTYPSDLDPNSPTYAQDLLAEELCNGKLDRCENDPNGGTALLAFETDNDGDGFVECVLDVDPAQWADSSDTILGGADCDDSNAQFFPNKNWYFDGDGDGWGNSSIVEIECTQPLGYVDQSPDCNDSSAFTFPGAAPLTDPSACLTDVDGDGLADRQWDLCDQMLDVSESNLAIVGGSYGFMANNAGDLDGDGFDDLYAFNYNNGEKGTIEILLGSSFQNGSAIGPNDFDYSMASSGTWALGSQMTPLGDMDGDGLDDFLIRGSTTYSNMAATLYFVKGASLDPNNPNQTPQAIGIPIYPENFDENRTHNLGEAGDVDGDGILDFIIGTDLEDGKAHLFLGANLDFNQSEWYLSDADYVFLGANQESAGDEVTILGDIDGDNLDDIAIGASENSDGASNGGKIYVVLASSLNPINPVMDLSASDYQFTGIEVNKRYAQVLGGDVDGDGLSDILISGERYTLNRGHFAFLHFAANLDPSAPNLNLDENEIDFVFTPYYSWGTIQNIAMGDADGDGLQDILLGDQQHGFASLVFGSSIQQNSSPFHVFDADHLFSGQNVGRLVNFIDMDNDGQDDVIVGGDSEYHLFLPCEN